MTSSIGNFSVNKRVLYIHVTFLKINIVREYFTVSIDKDTRVLFDSVYDN